MKEINNPGWLDKVNIKAKEQDSIDFIDGELPICCGTCEHLRALITEEPCYTCNNSYDKWERPQI